MAAVQFEINSNLATQAKAEATQADQDWSRHALQVVRSLKAMGGPALAELKADETLMAAAIGKFVHIFKLEGKVVMEPGQSLEEAILAMRQSGNATYQTFVRCIEKLYRVIGLTADQLDQLRTFQVPLDSGGEGPHEIAQLKALYNRALMTQLVAHNEQLVYKTHMLDNPYKNMRVGWILKTGISFFNAFHADTLNNGELLIDDIEAIDSVAVGGETLTAALALIESHLDQVLAALQARAVMAPEPTGPSTAMQDAAHTNQSQLGDESSADNIGRS